MEKLNNKKLLQILFALALFLLVLNIIIDKIITNKNSIPVSDISSSKIDSIFLYTLTSFAIENNLIKKINNSKKRNGEFINNYQIEVPADLPLPVLICELQNNFSLKGIVFKAFEKQFNSQIFVEIFFNKELNLKAELISDSNLVRNSGAASFIISDYEKLSEIDRNELLNSEKNFSVLLLPSSKNIFELNKLKEKHKEGIILIRDDIEELKFRIDAGYSKKRINYAVKDYCLSFIENKIFLIDNKSNLYNSTVYSFLKNEFAKMNRALIPINQFSILTDADETELKNLFNTELKKFNNNFNKVFVLDVFQFYMLKNEIDALRKQGVKVKLFSII